MQHDFRVSLENTFRQSARKCERVFHKRATSAIKLARLLRGRRGVLYENNASSYGTDSTRCTRPKSFRNTNNIIIALSFSGDADLAVETESRVSVLLSIQLLSNVECAICDSPLLQSSPPRTVAGVRLFLLGDIVRAKGETAIKSSCLSTLRWSLAEDVRWCLNGPRYSRNTRMTHETRRVAMINSVRGWIERFQDDFVAGSCGSRQRR